MPKKTFSQNMPAELFIDSSPAPAQTAGKIAPAPEGYYINPAYIEARTRRVQLMLKPSLYQKGKETAQAKGISFNELINSLLEEM